MSAPEIEAGKTGKVPTEYLEFDPNNPRLIEEGVTDPTDAAIIQALADTADLSEVVQSIAANGYIDIEPMVAMRVDDCWRVLEGNRRLAAIRILQNPDLAKGTGVTPPGELEPGVADSLKEVTVYAVSDPDQARDFIGFKHINGPHKWDAYAKGRFAADWYRREKDNGVTVAKIARRLGDRHDTVLRLVNGIFVLDQAQAARVYDLRDRYPGRRFAFSHLYTALTRGGYREFLGLADEWRSTNPEPDPVPEHNIDNLRRVLIWLYGTKSDDIPPVVTSQNPHIKQLGIVLQNSRARSVMLASNDLRAALAHADSKSERFEKSLITASQEAENALGQVTGFDASDATLLQIGYELRDTSVRLHNTMVSMAEEAVAPKAKGK